MSHIEPHDEFLELCAVSTSGQLTQEERKKLDEHLTVCSTCREAIKQYESLVAHAVPALASEELSGEVDPGPSWSQQRAEAALLNRIAQEEHRERTRELEQPSELPKTSEQVFPLGRGSTWQHVWTLYAATALLAVALGICLYQVGIHRGINSAKVIIPPIQQNQTSLEAQLSDIARDRELALAQLADRDREIANLRKRLVEQSATIAQIKSAQDQLGAERQNDIAAKQDLAQHEAELKNKLEAAQANIQAVQQKLGTLTKQSAEDQAHAAGLTAQVKDLTAALGERDAALDQKDELLAKDRDIRELMGARDLLVTEVYDVARTGTRKAYGRVFYTRGKSLIFYAYDLNEEPDIKNASTFQAWAQRGPDRKKALSLGIFYIDNPSKKRWVLKMDDPKALAEIDAVFVTVEPQGGSHKPSGKPLLFAYLKAESNHP